MKTLIKIILLLLMSKAYSQESTAPTQNVKGYVRDFQTQQPIIGATVMLIDTKFGSITKSDGSFIIKEVPVARYSLAIRALGYENFLQNIVLTSGKEIVINAQLNVSFVSTKELTVTAQKNSFESVNESSIVSSSLFTVDDLERYAGARSDPARMAQNFAGVVGGNDQRNDIIIRGGSPLELLWRIDGLDVPNPNHFATQGATGGPISAINSRVLDNSDFITGAFSAEYGDRMSGVFDLRTRKGNRDKWEYMGQFGFNGLEAGIEGPISENSSLILNYRYSFLDLLEMMGVDFGFSGVPRFQDFNLKYDWDIDKDNRLSVTTIMATSDINIQESKQEEVGTGDFDIKNGTDMIATGVTWQQLYNENSYGKLMIGGVFTRYRTSLDSITTLQNTNQVTDLTPWVDNQSSESYATAKYSFHYSPDNRNFITAGVETRFRTYDLNEQRLTTAWNSDTLFYVKADGNALHTLSFVNWNYRMSEDLTINIGLHSQYLEINNEVTLEPRASIRYRLDNLNSLNFGYGLHRQSPPLVLFFGHPDNNNLSFMQSQHFIAGWNTMISSDAQLKIEAYYKDISKAPIETAVPSSWSLLNSGTGFGSIQANIQANSGGIGRAYGTELSFQKQFSNGWYLTTTASYIRQEYQGSDRVNRFGAFDNIFVANLLGGYEIILSDDFTIEISGRATIAGGNPIIPVDENLSRRNNRTELDWSNAYRVRNPNYNKIDLRIDFRQNFDGMSLISFFSIENVLNQQNPLFQIWSANKQDISTAYQLGFFPIGGFRLEF